MSSPCSRTPVKPLSDDVLKSPVGLVLDNLLHLGALDDRLGVAIGVVSVFHGDCYHLCCLIENSPVSNVERLLVKLLPGLPRVTAGAGCTLVFEGGEICRFLRHHKKRSR